MKNAMKQGAIRVGLIGCGRIARVHTAAIDQLDELNLIAFCDTHKGRLEALLAGRRAAGYTCHQDLIEKESPDLVVIATPNGTHYSIAKDCLERGLHILLEKPITITDQQALDLMSAARKKGCHFFAVKQVRYNPSVRALKHAVDTGCLGRLVSAALVVRWTRPQAYFDQSDWRGTRKLDGGSLLNQGIHYVDIMQWLMGDVHTIIGHVDRFAHRIEIEDAAAGLIRFANQALGTLEFSINTWPQNLECSLAVFGETGSVKLSGSAMNEIETWIVKDMPRPVLPEGFAPYIYEGGLYQGSCPNHLFVYKDIVRVFSGSGEGYVDGAEALRSLRIVNALYESARTGRAVTLKKESR
ncbi:MAG TPA: Gfo/Idh/MocA family oxidoreductase [bacterium]|nr:Gfo/Idh/MocA family oxidoreductase [bacterium]